MSEHSTTPSDPLSDEDFDALEQALEASLTGVQTTTDLLPPIHVYQETRRQILRKRPKADKKPEDSYHHGNLRASLISITMEQAEAKGISDLSLRTIAKQAGVSAPALYRHFQDKEALLAAVAEQGFEELHDWLKFAAPREMPCRQRLRRFFEAYLEFMAAYPVYFQLMFGPEFKERGRYPGLLKAHESSMSLLIHVIVKGREQNVFTTTVSAEAQVLSCWSALHGYAGLYITGMLGSDKNLLDTLLEGLSKGLNPQ
ncbi:MAG: TetR/AcrR family transcriptional regulator [Candidatus Sericytochromatia bacterium]